MSDKIDRRQARTKQLLHQALMSLIKQNGVDCVMHWLESGMNLTPRQMGTLMTQIINHGPIIAPGLRENPLNH
ncbi:TetR-like C-terminal domain-containing protein [Cohnella luojiensis]|uniref:Uncharacterized protein n=1 Tax=Cohnella luojiensis TaxID=652876 RepID=A0A4Y8LUR1_9BACL|nr:TetR-like C-terminal domain-containing protein [Cohnella luojiensis]TFE25410.1 hypothetical protein E2980_13930 [Cohnella luojiensis]